MKYAAGQTDGHRRDEVRRFAESRLEAYRSYYHPARGGFSFYPGRANTTYYGARISRGLPEPDIHGTMLFTWGVSILAPMLGMENEIALKEIPT